MTTFIKHRNYRLDLPLGGAITYTVQQRTSKAVFLHNGKSKQFSKPVFQRDGAEVVYLRHHDYDHTLVLTSKNLVESGRQ